MRRFTRILFPISVVLFMCSIAIGLLGRAFCTRSNDDYKSIQPESFVPDTIETVLEDENLKQIYDEIYKDGVLQYEIETFDENGNCEISYYRKNTNQKQIAKR